MLVIHCFSLCLLRCLNSIDLSNSFCATRDHLPNSLRTRHSDTSILGDPHFRCAHCVRTSKLVLVLVLVGNLNLYFAYRSGNDGNLKNFSSGLANLIVFAIDRCIVIAFLRFPLLRFGYVMKRGERNVCDSYTSSQKNLRSSLFKIVFKT